MPSNSLNSADAPEWSREADYSPTVAAALRGAYRSLRLTSGRLDAQAWAHQHLSACLRLPMSLRQRMRAHYVLGMSFAAVGDVSKALGCLDEVLELATRLRDFYAYAECAYLCGSVLRATSHGMAAASYLTRALEALRGVNADTGMSLDPALEVDILLSLSGQEFLLAQFQSAAYYLTEARQHLHATRDQFRQSATIEWIVALLDRWRGSPASALPHALAAADMLAKVDSPASYGRIQTIVADVILDLAETMPDASYAKTNYLLLAEPHVEQALALARVHDARDEGGEALARLAYVRYSRLNGTSNDRPQAIAEIVQLAERTHDMPLLGQAMTCMGNELASRGEEERAMHCYRAALDVLAEHEVPVLGIWPRRALLIASEMEGEQIKSVGLSDVAE